MTRPSRLGTGHIDGRGCGPYVQTIWLQHFQDWEASPLTFPGRLRFRLTGGRGRGLQYKCESKLVQREAK